MSTNTITEFVLQENTSRVATYTFSAQYQDFKSGFKASDQELQKVLNNMKGIKAHLGRTKKALKVTFGGKSFTVFPGGEIGDKDYNFRRFSGCLLTFCYQAVKKVPASNLVNPIAEAKGIPKENKEMYWSFGPGTYMNPDMFEFYPAAIDFIQVKSSNDLMQYFQRACRIRANSGVTVMDMINKDQAKFIETVKKVEKFSTGQNRLDSVKKLFRKLVSLYDL